ncbi:MAG: hypothetical protein U9N87_14045, partial [Planctomycetota bacterium]|nr:hypothetical protein [Planctomycetota bacterium]
VPGPRIIKFRVGGTIELAGPLVIRKNGRVTIDGASAARHGGVTLRDYGLEFEDCDDVIVTHIRQRRARMDNGADGGCFGLLGCSRVLFDHCSGAWSTDENFGVFRVADVTFQWCISAEGLIQGGHPKGAHSMGLIAHRARGVTIHHCLFANNVARNPRWKGNWGLPWGGNIPPPDLPNGLDEQGRRIYPVFDIRNNVFHNYVRGGYVDFVPRTNFIGNVYKAGPSTPPGAVELGVAGPHPKFGYARLFVWDNLGPHRSNNQLDQWALVKVASQKTFGSIPEVLSAKPFDTPAVKTQPAAEAFEFVLREAGAHPLDATDRRIIREVREGKGKAGWQGTP